MSAGERLPGTPTPMHTWTGAGGLTIAGDTWGDPNGPVVVLQHGAGQTRHAWKGGGETLGSAGYYAVAFDARGHGDSGWAPADKYGPDYMVKDLICVIDPAPAPRMASPKTSGSAPMASITGTGILPGAPDGGSDSPPRATARLRRSPACADALGPGRSV